jgi:hypothetical protein
LACPVTHSSTALTGTHLNSLGSIQPGCREGALGLSSHTFQHCPYRYPSQLPGEHTAWLPRRYSWLVRSHIPALPLQVPISTPWGAYSLAAEKVLLACPVTHSSTALTGTHVNSLGSIQPGYREGALGWSSHTFQHCPYRYHSQLSGEHTAWLPRRCSWLVQSHIPALPSQVPISTPWGAYSLAAEKVRLACPVTHSSTALTGTHLNSLGSIQPGCREGALGLSSHTFQHFPHRYPSQLPGEHTAWLPRRCSWLVQSHIPALPSQVPILTPWGAYGLATEKVLLACPVTHSSTALTGTQLNSLGSIQPGCREGALGLSSHTFQHFPHRYPSQLPGEHTAWLPRRCAWLVQSHIPALPSQVPISTPWGAYSLAAMSSHTFQHCPHRYPS